MKPRSRRIVAGCTVLCALAACGPATDEGQSDPSEANSAESAVPDVPRTADPTRRGFTEADFPRVQEVAPDVYTYEALRSAGDERFTTVSMFVVTDDGVLVADGQGSVEETQRMIDHIAGVTDQPITHLVIGSDHGDHTAGNSAFPDGITVIAHPASAEALERAAEAADPGQIVPRATALVEDSASWVLGGTTIEVLFLGRGHTAGDLAVHLPEEKVLFLSEAYLNRVFPAMRTAYPSEWVAALERAQAMDIDVYVPGHGFVETPEILREELATYTNAVRHVIEVSRALHEQGLSLEEAGEQVDFGDLESWSLRDSQRLRSLQQVYAELNGDLPALP